MVSGNDNGQGALAPAVVLTAVGSGRRVNLQAIGQPAVLLVQTYETAQAAEVVNIELRRVYPRAGQLLIASVVDLNGVPRPLHRMAQGAMKKVYQEAARRLPQDARPEEYVIILPDWKGEVSGALGLRNLKRQAGLMVLDRQGQIVGAYQGEGPALAGAALQVLGTAVP